MTMTYAHHIWIPAWPWPQEESWFSGKERLVMTSLPPIVQTRQSYPPGPPSCTCLLHIFPTSVGYYNSWSSPSLWDDELPELEVETTFANDRSYYVISSSDSKAQSECTASTPRDRSLSAPRRTAKPGHQRESVSPSLAFMQPNESSTTLPSTGGSGTPNTHSTVTRQLSKSEKKSLKRAKSGDALSKAITPAIAMEEAPSRTPANDQDSSEDSDRPIPKKPFHQSHDEDHGTWEATKSVIKIKGANTPSERKSIQWEATRIELRKRTCPVVRFRAELSWRGVNHLYSIGKQKQHGIHVITVRAIGSTAKHLNGCYTALVSALVTLGIKPIVIQRQILHTDWPNEWILHIPNEEALRLPSYTSDSKGVLYNATGPPFFFSWNLIPRTSSEEANSEYRFLRFIAHAPAFGPLPDADNLPFTTKLMVANKGGDDTALHVSNVRFQGFQEDGWHYCSGDYVVTVDQIPLGDTFDKFWKSATNKTVSAMWEDVSVRLTLANPCQFCGAEQHPNGEDCEFKAVVDLLEERKKQGKFFPNN
ncbi:hypothetical protein PCASD_25907 [Puccinia coronata f. sp. avenae]|uniref:Uncharacterized protein n=1 Tax=Puccinia coronata f. sp. avenae TaxID=200324 RepID=A0A2N5THI9_9BASI|nr:hypothetical protein PCASD_25907 [Puccinia coronata f. sp. avenae]